MIRRGMSVLLVGCASLVGCTTPEDAPAVEVWTFGDAQVVAAVKHESNSDIVRSRVGSGQAERVVDLDVADNYPRLSPDGSLLAFQSRPAGGTIDIFVRPLAGGDVVNVSNDPAHDVLPAWSPDGSWLAFMSTRGFELGGAVPFPGHLYLVAPDGTGLRQVTRRPLESSLGPQDWTRDGRFLLLSRKMDDQLDVFRLDVATGGETRITTDLADEYGCAVSPDGERLACHAALGEETQLVVLNLDGSERREVTYGPGRRYGPRWSPDGKWLLYTAQGDGDPPQHDVRALNLEDGRDVAVLFTADDEREADWIR